MKKSKNSPGNFGTNAKKTHCVWKLVSPYWKKRKLPPVSGWWKALNLKIILIVIDYLLWMPYSGLVVLESQICPSCLPKSFSISTYSILGDEVAIFHLALSPPSHQQTSSFQSSYLLPTVTLCRGSAPSLWLKMRTLSSPHAVLQEDFIRHLPVCRCCMMVYSCYKEYGWAANTLF